MIIEKDPLGLTRPVIKPGCLPEPGEPPEPVRTRESPEFVAACLSCPLPDCNMSSSRCLLYGYSPGSCKRKWKRREKP